MNTTTNKEAKSPALYIAVRGQDYGTCEALRWAYTSIRPYILAEGSDEEDVLERGIKRAGHDDVRTYAK
jgi:hypothetical protein